MRFTDGLLAEDTSYLDGLGSAPVRWGCSRIRGVSATRSRWLCSMRRPTPPPRSASGGRSRSSRS